MSKQLLWLVVILFTVSGVSCASRVSPVLPSDAIRGTQDFSDAMFLFWPYGSDIFAWDVDLASVIVGPNPPSGQYTGDIWDRTLLPEDPWNYCAGVSMRREDTDKPGQPYCSWMENDQPGLSQTQTKWVITAAEHQVASFGPCHNTFNFPRCDAMYFDGTSQSTTSVVELAVCYMINGTAGSGGAMTSTNV
jgi:hypothetical protein